MNLTTPTPELADQEHDAVSRLLAAVQRASALGVFRFPAGLERDFLDKRVRDSRTIITAGRYYLILIVAGLFLKNLWMHPELLEAHRFRLVWLTYLPLTIAVTGILAGHRIRWIRDRHYAFMTCFGALAVWGVTMSAALVRQPEYSAMTGAYVAVTMALVTFGLRLLTVHFLPMMLLAGGLAVLTAHWLASPVSWLAFLHYYVLFAGVMAGLGAITEWQERSAFLQGRLLDIQTRRLESLNDRLDRLARHDPLTGLFNRRAFDEAFDREWERAVREQRPLSVLFMDVDYFKLYNDSMGHAQGDVCLQRVAGALERSLLRATDIVARYGGEEFVILLPGTGAAGAEEIARRVAAEVRDLNLPHPRSAVSERVTLSTGVAALTPGRDDSPAQLLRQADSALYEAKDHGRNRHVLFRPARGTTGTPLAV